jgi:hypothetical protein
MTGPWLTTLSGITVERKEIGRPGGKPYYANTHTQIAVLHTTEGGDGLEGAWATLAKNHDAPHFIVGRRKNADGSWTPRIVQCRPLMAQAAALRGQAPYFANANAQLQIEICANTPQPPAKPWLPAQETLDALVAVLVYAVKEMGIPMQKPDLAWKDDASDIKTIWAIEYNTRRVQAAKGLWPKAKGVWFHLEVPGNNHYDCGTMNRTAIFDLVFKALSR